MNFLVQVFRLGIFRLYLPDCVLQLFRPPDFHMEIGFSPSGYVEPESFNGRCDVFHLVKIECSVEVDRVKPESPG